MYAPQSAVVLDSKYELESDSSCDCPKGMHSTLSISHGPTHSLQSQSMNCEGSLCVIVNRVGKGRMGVWVYGCR